MALPNEDEDRADGRETSSNAPADEPRKVPVPAENDDEGEDTPDAGEDEGDADEGDEGEDKPVLKTGDAGGDELPPRPSRREARIETLNREAREQRERAARAEAALQALQTERQQQQAQMTAQQEQEALTLMSPEERMDYRLTKAERRFQATLQMQQMQTQDITDKASFDAKAATHPAYAKYKDKVETKLVELRSQGQNVAREQLLKWVIGEEALSQATKAGGKAAQQAGRRVDRETVAPSNARGDRGSDRGKTADTPAKRLEGLLI